MDEEEEQLDELRQATNMSAGVCKQSVMDALPGRGLPAPAGRCQTPGSKL
ncbi:uncharacterized protein V6R79_002667 [Siganus canaliculatus]